MRQELLQAVKLLQHNSPESLEEAVALLQSTVFSFSMKVCGHPQDAEDTTQEVLYRSLGHLARLQDPRALAVWLYTVTRNRCWRMRKKPANSSSRTLSLDELMPSDAELGRLLQDNAPGPETQLLHAEQHQLLHKAVLAIPAPLRIVLVLHDMEELTTEEVAQVLGLQPGTVRVRLHRARLAVRRQISRILDEASAAGSRARAAASAAVRKPGRKAAKRSRRPAACRQLFAGLSDYLDGRVEPRACRQMARHIEGCPSCVAFLNDLRAAIDRCRSLQVPCDPKIAARLRATLNREVRRMSASPAAKEISARM